MICILHGAMCEGFYNGLQVENEYGMWVSSMMLALLCMCLCKAFLLFAIS
jgi:hypothetical protein